MIFHLDKQYVYLGGSLGSTRTAGDAERCSALQLQRTLPPKTMFSECQLLGPVPGITVEDLKKKSTQSL